jgi:hypothetical protein
MAKATYKNEDHPMPHAERKSPRRDRLGEINFKRKLSKMERIQRMADRLERTLPNDASLATRYG